MMDRKMMDRKLRKVVRFILRGAIALIYVSGCVGGLLGNWAMAVGYGVTVLVLVHYCDRLVRWLVS